MAFWEPQSAALTVRRILKVNHAGEFGAIRIYNAQLALARYLYPDIVPALTEMRDDEIEHCRLFLGAMPARGARPCRVMAFWSLGGYVLGFATALLGRNMIWVCTEAVEATVHRHLEDQIAFLRDRDQSLHDLIGIDRENQRGGHAPLWRADDAAGKRASWRSRCACCWSRPRWRARSAIP